MMTNQSWKCIIGDFCSVPPIAPLGSRNRRRRVIVLAAVLTCLPWFNRTGGSLAGPSEKPAYRFGLSEDEWPHCVAFSPDGGKVFAGTNKGRLWIWEVKKGAVPEKVRLSSGGLLTGSVLSLAISLDGSRALAGCADHRVRVVDLGTAKVTHILRGHDTPVFSVSFSRDGQRALSGSSGNGTIFQWDLKTGKQVSRSDGEDVVDGLAISPDQKRFLTTEFMAVQEWDFQSGKRIRTLKGHEARLAGVFYSPDGQTIISGGWDGVRVWDAKTGKCVRTVWDGKFNAERCALSPDGRRILLGGVKAMQLLDLKTGKELKRWDGLAGNVRVTFSPDGRYALSGEEHAPVSLWALPEEDTNKETPARK